MNQLGGVEGARDEVETARREAAAASARLAAACVRFADLRTAANQQVVEPAGGGRGRPKPAEFVADEVSVLVREQPYHVRCLIARSRRLAANLPTVWKPFWPEISTPTRCASSTVSRAEWPSRTRLLP